MAEEKANGEEQEKETKDNSLYDAVQRLILELEPSKIKASLIPLFPETSRNYYRHLLQGSPLRRLLFITVGIVAFVVVSGFVAFMLFFLAATLNAVFVSLLISLAVAGGFLALFFAFVTAIFIGALSVAIFAISTVTFWAVVAILVTAGWVGFLYTVWLVIGKSLGLAKQSLSVTGSAITTYSAAWGTRNRAHKNSI